MITERQLQDRERAYQGLLQAGFNEQMAAFLASVSAGIIAGDIIEDEDAARWREHLDGRQPEVSSAGAQ